MRNQKLAFSNAETGKNYGYKKDETVIYHCTQIEKKRSFDFNLGQKQKPMALGKHRIFQT